MSTTYPHQHFHPHQSLGNAMRPICAYCLHLLVHGQGAAGLSQASRRELEDHHDCAEKTTARTPNVSLPYN